MRDRLSECFAVASGLINHSETRTSLKSLITNHNDSVTASLVMISSVEFTRMYVFALIGTHSDPRRVILGICISVFTADVLTIFA